MKVAKQVQDKHVLFFDPLCSRRTISELFRGDWNTGKIAEFFECMHRTGNVLREQVDYQIHIFRVPKVTVSGDGNTSDDDKANLCVIQHLNDGFEAS